MPPKPKYNIQADGLSYSRTRCEGVKAPRRPDEDDSTQPTRHVPPHVAKRVAYEKRQEKEAIAAEIEADPLANNDSPEQEDLSEWIAPTFTGDNALDNSNYVEERIAFLVKFIAQRDGYDVRPELEAEDFGLEELEEIYLDGPEANTTDATPQGNHSQGKGKGKGKGKVSILDSSPSNMDVDTVMDDTDANINAKTNAGSKSNANSKATANSYTKATAPAGESAATPTAYKGITAGKTETTVASKNISKGTNSYSRPTHLDGLSIMSTAQSAASRGSGPALRRTDSTTWFDGCRITDYGAPVVQTPKSSRPTKPTVNPNPAPNRGPRTSLETPPACAVGTAAVPVGRSNNAGARSCAVSTNGPTLSTPDQSQAGATPSCVPWDPCRSTNAEPITPPGTSHRSHISKNPGNARRVALDNVRPSASAVQQPGQNSTPSNNRSNERQMPTNATASIYGYGDRHVVSHSKIVANARSSQNAGVMPAPKPTPRKFGKTGSVRHQPYPQSRQNIHQRTPDRRSNNRPNNTHEQHQVDNNPMPELDLEQDEGRAAEQELELEEDQTAGPNMVASVNNPKYRNKAPIASFNDNVRPLVKKMTDLAKPQIVANGVYDNTEAVIATASYDWPNDKEWNPRVSREVILAKCWASTCTESRVQIPFSRKLTLCADSLMTSFCTTAKKAIKPVVDKYFGFPTAEPADVKKLCSRLLDHSFHDTDYKIQKNPFEGKYLHKACQAVAFNGPSSMAAKNPDIFDFAPPPYIAFICAITHHVILCYRGGSFSTTETLSGSMQSLAFRIYMDLIVEMHENLPRILCNVRGEISDFCWSSIKGGPVKAAKPQPSRQWGPDTDEVYIRKFNFVNDTEAEADHPREHEYALDGSAADGEDYEDDNHHYDGDRVSNEQYDGGQAKSSRAGGGDSMMVDG